MSSPALASALAQLQTLASQAAGQPAGATPLSTAAGEESGFAGELRASLARINALQQHAAAKAEAFQAGTPGVELDEVMVDMQKASVAFQMGLQVRNRLVTAYKDVMNMQV